MEKLMYNSIFNLSIRLWIAVVFSYEFAPTWIIFMKLNDLLFY